MASDMAFVHNFSKLLLSDFGLTDQSSCVTPGAVILWIFLLRALLPSVLPFGHKDSKTAALCFYRCIYQQLYLVYYLDRFIDVLPSVL